MTDLQHRHMDLNDYVHELTERHDNREDYQIREHGEWKTRHWSTKVPSLLEQLWTNDTPSQTVEEGPRPGFASKPAARLDALDAAVRIDLEASRWVRDLGEDDPSDTAACVRLLNGLAASADYVTRKAIEHDVRRWWIKARIVTGWDSPAWTPDNTCPQCGERGTLKVRLADRVAMCTNDACRAVWDPSCIGLLADHIRAESTAERRPREVSGPCWCPWPEPDVPDLGRMCPRCGSARCWHAVRLRLMDSLASVSSGRIGA